MGILGRLADRLEGMVNTGAHKKDVGARVPAHAAMGATVLRFQGCYECGCVPEGWQERLVPEFCEAHGGAKVYAPDEIVVVQTDDVVMAPREIFE